MTTRMHWVLLLSIVFAAIASVHYICSEPQPDIADVASRNVDAGATVSAENTMAEPNNIGGDTAPIDAIAKWKAAAGSEDQGVRDAAILALAAAPKQQALSILQQLLSAGGDRDRQAAVNALRTLALEQGDADKAVQEMLRLTAYDGDDAIAGDAQLALADIERGSI